MNSYLTNKKKEIAIVSLMMVLLLGLGLIGLNNWFYSVIGDEYAFLVFIKRVHFQVKDIFNQEGVYGYHPELGSIYQYLIYQLGGQTNSSWRLSSVLISVATVPFLYGLTKNLFNRGAAFFALILFCFSSYILAYSHLGYDNIQAIFPFVTSLYFITKAIKSGKKRDYFMSGLMAGLGWYTFYTARVTMVVTLIFYVFNIKPTAKKNFINLLSLFSGFLLFLIPFLIRNQATIWSQMIYQSVLNHQWLGSHFNNPLIQWWENFRLNWGAFMMGKMSKHYVTAPLLDRVSGIMVLSSIIMGLRKKYRRNYLFLMATYLFLVAIIALNPGKEIVISRWQLAIVVLTIGGGLGVELGRQLFKPLVMVLVIGIIFLNIKHFYFDLPISYSINNQSLIIKAIQTTNKSLLIYEGKTENPTFRDIVESYRPKFEVLFTNDQKPIKLKGTYQFIDNYKSENGKESVKLYCQNYQPKSICQTKLLTNCITVFDCW